MRLTASIMLDGREFTSIEVAADHLSQRLSENVERGMVAITREMRTALDDLYLKLERKHGRGWPTGGAPFGTNPDSLSRRTGGGLLSIKNSIAVAYANDAAQGVITTGRLTVHETGAVITARRSKYLALPMIAALDSRGQPRRRSPREWQNTFVAFSRRGNLIIFQKRTGGKVVPLYMLKKKVVMPRRLGMQQAFEDMAPHFVAKAVRELEAALQHVE